MSVTQISAGPIMDRRKPTLCNRMIRAAWGFLYSGDLPTEERMLIAFKVMLAVAVLVFTHRIIAVPPPAWKGWILLLPSPVWAFLLITSATIHCIGRQSNRILWRRNGSAAGFLTCVLLLGPLWVKAPMSAVLVFGATVWICTVTVRLHSEYCLSRKK